MNDNKEIKTIIKELIVGLNNVIYSKDISYSVLRLLFLKYVVDNFIGTKTVEDMQFCSRAQKMFAMRDIENGVETIKPVLSYIDNYYGLSNILSCQENINAYENELFGNFDERKKKNATDEGFKNVMTILGSFDLEEKENGHFLGQGIVNALMEQIISPSLKSSYTGMFTTSNCLSNLASAILDVQGTDTFCDFTSGVGASTLVITKGANPAIINVDVNRTAISIASMLYIMYGYSNIKLINSDSLSEVTDGIKGTKIFVDPPVASRLSKSETNEFTDASFAAINRVINNYLSDDETSTAVITMPSSPLFVSYKLAVALREKLIKEGTLKAVVALPPLWKGTNVGTNIMVLTRKKNSNVVFINAADYGTKVIEDKDSDIKIRQNTFIISDDIIKKISETISTGADMEGFSHLASMEEIAENDYNFLPARYIQVELPEDNITLSEIDEQLATLYAQLKL